MEVDEAFEFHGEVFRIRSGEIGKFADQAVFAFHGNTSVFNSLVYDKKFDEAINDDPSFVPLTVEYREKDFAGGKIPSNFSRKETMSEHDILIGRKIDRALRPMLPRGLSREIQLLSTLYSYDYKNLPDVVALNGLATAILLSEVPILRGIAAVRVAYIPSQGFIAMPSAEQIAESTMDLFYAGTWNECVMIEVEAEEVHHQDVVGAGLHHAHKALKPMLRFQNRLIEKYGKSKLWNSVSTIDNDVMQASNQKQKKVRKLWREAETQSKEGRSKAQSQITKSLIEEISCEKQYRRSDVVSAVSFQQEKYIRDLTLQYNKRIDGWELETVRDIDARRDVIPQVHGSGFFSRGDTQALCTVTLGGMSDRQRVTNSITSGPYDKSFFLQYDFPPYSVNEIGRVGGINRRMIGHGALAEKALAPVLPKSTLLSIEDAIDFVNYGKNREAAMDELRDCIREQDEKGSERKMKREEEVKAATKAHKRKMAQKKKKIRISTRYTKKCAWLRR